MTLASRSRFLPPSPLAPSSGRTLVPAGKFARVPGPDGRQTIDPDSYERVAQTPVGLIDLMTAIPAGIIAAGIALCATAAGFCTGIINPINAGLGRRSPG